MAFFPRRHRVRYHAPVAQYWPEFACNGKEQASVAMLLNHSVGLPALRKPVDKGGFCDWDYMVDRLSLQIFITILVNQADIYENTQRP